MSTGCDRDYEVSTFVAYLGKDLGPEQLTEIEKHLKTCETCKEKLEKARTVVSGLRTEKVRTIVLIAIGVLSIIGITICAIGAGRSVQPPPPQTPAAVKAPVVSKEKKPAPAAAYDEQSIPVETEEEKAEEPVKEEKPAKEISPLREQRILSAQKRDEARKELAELRRDFSKAEKQADYNLYYATGVKAGQKAEEYRPDDTSLRLKALEMECYLRSGKSADYANEYLRYIDLYKGIRGNAGAVKFFKKDIQVLVNDKHYDTVLSILPYVQEGFQDDSDMQNWATFMLADCYRRMGLSDMALARFEDVKDVKGNEYYEEAVMKVGYLHMRENNWDKARETFSRYLENHPGGRKAPYAHYSIGWIYDSLGQQDKAVKEYKLVMEKYPRSEWASESRKRVNKFLEGIIEDVIEF